MKLVMIGPPGAGKGTQTKVLCSHYNIPHISTGDLLRLELQNQTELGQKVQRIMSEGGLVPDDIVIDMLVKRINNKDCDNGYILDGFPRTVSQAEALIAITGDIDKAIYIGCSDEALLERLTARRICPECGKIYNIIASPPKEDSVCDNCGCALIQREDDNETSVAERISVYHKMTKPVVDYFEKKGSFVRIEGEGNIDDITNAVFAALGE